jgi:lysozyme family protein
MNFDAAFDQLHKFEGSYSNHAADPGGETMYGITKFTANSNGYFGEMKDLPLETAKAIYKKQYWDTVKAEEIPKDLRYAMFDAAVNCGPVQAIKWLQKSCGVLDDGVIGPKTLSAVNGLAPDGTKRKIIAYQIKFKANLATWPMFGKGWMRRIADILEM